MNALFIYLYCMSSPINVFQSGFPVDAEFERGQDILDIWFESGVSWATVLTGKN